MAKKAAYNTLQAMYYSDDVDFARRRILEILKSLDGDGCTERQLVLWIQTSTKIVRRVLRTLEDLQEVYRYKGKDRAVLWDYNLKGRPDPPRIKSPLGRTTIMGAGQSCNHCRSLNNGPTQDRNRCWHCGSALESPPVSEGTDADADNRQQGQETGTGET